MDTVDFLSRVLPDHGLRVVVQITSKGPRQSYFADNESAAQAILAADARGVNVYHACASYQNNTSRKADNVEAVKALWLDLDCGDTKPYETQALAGAAAVQFTETIGLPPPLLVNSGRGLHVYWIFEEAICADDWRNTATLLKLAAQHAGLLADPARTADVASILRTPGTHNHKADPLPVLAIRDGRVAPHSYIHDKLAAYCVEHDLNPLANRPKFGKVDNSDLEVSYNGPPASAHHIADQCAIIGEFRNSKGCIEEPLWRACMGVVRHCEDGPELCHEWSSGHEHYTAEETDAKIAGLEGTGPTTCVVLEAYRPAACAACPLRGTCKSPIAAGYKAPPITEIENPADPTAAPIALPTAPDGFEFRADGLYGMVWEKGTDAKNPTGRMTKISSMILYPVAWVTDNDQDRTLVIRSHLTPTETEDWTLDCGTIGEGGAKLRSHLAKKMVTWEKGKDSMLQAYMMKYMSLMLEKQRSLKAYNRFGWHGRDFLLGTTLFKADGTEVEVVLSESAETQGESYQPKGDLQTWVDTVDTAYNHPTLEPLQFGLIAGLAAPLLSMFQQYGGVTVYMHTQKSGEGKTTISRAALSCYGAWADTQLSYTQFTQNALFATFGTANALPLVLDELTAMDPKQAAEMIHIISSGTPKKRCEKQGALQKADFRWSTIAIASGNNLVTEKIGQYRVQAGAENARVFEYSIQDLKTPLPPAEAARLFPKFADHYGHSGRAFLRYVVDNYDTVREELMTTLTVLNDKLQIAQSERYWGALIACVVTTLRIARELELVQFPVAPLLRFIQTALRENRQAMVAATPVAEDQLGRLIADLWPGIFVTHGRGDIYNKWDCFVAKEAQGKITGRYIMRRPGPEGINDTPIVYLTVAAVREWCGQKHVSFRDLLREAASKGLVRPTEAKIALGAGSVKYSGAGHQACIVVNEKALPDTLSSGTPVLSVIKGGKALP